MQSSRTLLVLYKVWPRTLRERKRSNRKAAVQVAGGEKVVVIVFSDQGSPAILGMWDGSSRAYVLDAIESALHIWYGSSGVRLCIMFWVRVFGSDSITVGVGLSCRIWVGDGDLAEFGGYRWGLRLGRGSGLGCRGATTREISRGEKIGSWLSRVGDMVTTLHIQISEILI
uniref:Uncharacterized protein n=1 Tax=Cannabis sativa TaxID=3483 RepID=A0A803P841_CANSA